MNLLLERLKRGLRELGRTPRDRAHTQVDRAADRRDGEAVSQRRSELDAPPHASDNNDHVKAAHFRNGNLPLQQPTPPASTRLKKAVLSKARRASATRQSLTVWGALPGEAATGSSWIGAPAPEQPGLFTAANLCAADNPDPKPSQHAAPASSHGSFFSAPGHHHAGQQEHWPWAPPSAPAPPLGGEASRDAGPAPSLFDGAPVFGRGDEASPLPDRLF